MTDTDFANATDLRAALIDALRGARAIEREVMDALSAADRDAPAADGGWSPKDIQAHLSAWRRHQAQRLVAIREGRADDEIPAIETDATNAILHAERADWTWDHVAADADEASDALIAEISAADDATITADRIVGSTLGNGPEHDFAHLPSLAARTGTTGQLAALAAAMQASVDRGGWPARSAAFARYNLACYHALGGRLDEARTLLRQCLPVQEELRGFAAADDDLIALRDEIAALSAR
jgi:hypothetical protein